MPRPAHVSKRKPHGIPGLPRFNKLPMLCLKACSFKLSHCSFSLLTSGPLPTIHPREVPFLPSPACLGRGKFGPCSTRWSGLQTGLAWTAGFQPQSHLTPNVALHPSGFTSTSHPPRKHSLSRPPGMGAPCMEAQLRRQLPNHPDALACRLESPQRRLACRHRGTHLPRHPSQGGWRPGDPNGIERDDLASARGCPEPRGQPGGHTKSKGKR